MNKQTTLVVIIAVVVIGLFFYYKKADAPLTTDTDQTQATTTPEVTTPTTPTPTNTGVKMNSKGEYIITYNGVNFSPKTLSIPNGKSVVFINQSSKSMWVASDSHPDHGDYPEFDQDKTVGVGGSYHFTFIKAGVWGFHNHINPKATGTITVK